MGLLTVPKHYTPRKGAPRESLLYVSDAERRMIKAMTDGKLNRTKHGIMSAFMETSGGFKGGTTGIGTKSGGGSTAGKTSSGGMQGGPQNQNNPGGSGPRAGNSNSGNSNTGNGGGFGSMAGAGNTPGTRAAGGAGNQTKSGFGSGINTPNASGSPGNNPTGISNSSSRAIGNAIGSALGRSLGGISTPSASGSPVNNPASINVTPGNGSLQNAMIQRQAVNAMAPQSQSSLANQYSQYRSPNDFPYSGAEDLTRTGYMANQYGQYRSPPSQPVSNLGYQAPQAQQSGIFNRALSDSQLGNPEMGNPNNAGYRAAVKAAEALGGPAATQAENVYKALGFDDNQRAAMLGRNAVESGYFDPKVLSGERMGDAGTAYGLGQWRGPRIDGVKDFIGGISSSQSSPAAQAAAIANEMQFKEKSAYNALNSAKSVEDAMRAMNMYERPQGYKAGGNPANVVGYGDAMKYAQNYLNAPDSQPQTSTQVASIGPAMGPPVQQQQPSVPGPSLWQQYAPNGLQAAVAKAPEAYDAFTAANQKINKLGGGAKVQALGKVAQSIMSFLPNGDGVKSDFSSESAGGPSGRSEYGGSQINNTPPAPQTPAPPINPVPPANWPFPQYTQAWAGLPTGIGGPIWRPKPPSEGLFKPDTGKKKKKANA